MCVYTADEKMDMSELLSSSRTSIISVDPFIDENLLEQPPPPFSSFSILYASVNFTVSESWAEIYSKLMKELNVVAC